MSAKVAVLEPHGETPSEHVKKCVAQYLVRKALADWVIVNVVLRRRALRSIPASAYQSDPRSFSATPYIPDRMPPLELPNCKFEPPARHQTLAKIRRDKTFRDRAYPEQQTGGNQ